jgi:large subunit ribosomal protein L35
MGKNSVKRYKLKTHKATVKRFKVTGTGKVMRTKGGKSHLRRRKSSRVKRSLDKMQSVANNKQARRIKTLAPYLGRFKGNPPA